MVRRWVISTWRQPLRGSMQRNRLRVPLAPVLVILSPRPPRFRRYRRPGVGQQLGGGFVEADHWSLRVIGLGVKFQHILNGRHEVGAYLRNAPPLLLPRLEGAFFRCRRTLSWDSDSTSPNSTALPARARSVQWSYPLGAGVQPGR